MKQPSLPLLQTLAKNLKKYRHQKGLSQEKFAELCGYHRSYVSDVECAKRNITLQVLETMATALAISASELLIDKTENESSDALFY